MVRVAALPPIDATKYPHFPDPYRGDQTLVVRDGGGYFEYLAADDDTFARARALFDLATREREEPWTVVVQLASKHDFDRFREVRSRDGSEIARFSSGRFTQEGIEIELRTRDPDATLAALCAMLNEQELEGMRAGAHPQCAVRFRSLWPPDSTNFARADRRRL